MPDKTPLQIERAPEPRRIGKDADPKQLSERTGKPHTLVIDVGGTGIKMIVIDAAGSPLSERARQLTPDLPTPKAVLRVIAAMIPDQPPFDRVSVGFPGVMKGGVVHTATNLDPRSWPGFDLASALFERTGRPTRVVNDADLQGYGVVTGSGVEMVLTLGTGLGSALFVDGHLLPNLELGLHPFEKGECYEGRIGEAARKRTGKQRWRQRVHKVLDQVDSTFNPDIIWIGGGNADKLRPEDVPHNGRVFDPVAGLRGGVRLWKDTERVPLVPR